MTTLTFKRDHHLRRRFFIEQSFTHKAKLNLYWLAWLLDQHTDLHDIVLDPMGGTGSILLATTKQRPVLSGDLETPWCTLQQRNAFRIRSEMLFNAPALTCQWDAANLPLPSSSVPNIVTSPPYFDLFSDWNRKRGSQLDGNPDHIGETGLCYGFHPRQIANIHVYENYLRAMRQVYRECWRVLDPGGKLVLIVGDKVRKSRIVPVTRDAETLCQANGFVLIDKHERRTIPSRYRRIHAQNNSDYPMINVETAFVFKRLFPPPARCNLAIIEAPKPGSRPGRQLFHKQLAHAYNSTHLVMVLVKAGFYVGRKSNAVWSGEHPRKARQRKEWAFGIIHTLVRDQVLHSGDTVHLHVTDRYARYLQQRIRTLGATAVIPTARLNFGQKLTWYTRALQQDQTQLGPTSAPEGTQ